MYSRDSFFDLTPWGQVGLAAISLTLFVLTIIVSRKLLRPYGVWVRLFGAVVLFWIFVWISPQIYYTYYRMIIPDLPLQWVIWPPPPPGEALRMLIFSYRSNLSAHGQGVLGWAVIAAPFVRRRLFWT